MPTNEIDDPVDEIDPGRSSADVRGREREWGIGSAGGGRGAQFVGRGGFGTRGIGSIEFGGWRELPARHAGPSAVGTLRYPEQLNARMEAKVRRYLREAGGAGRAPPEPLAISH